MNAEAQRATTRTPPPAPAVYRELGGVPTPPNLRPISRAGDRTWQGSAARRRAARPCRAAPAWQAQAGSGGRGDRRPRWTAGRRQRRGAVVLHALPRRGSSARRGPDLSGPDEFTADFWAGSQRQLCRKAAGCRRPLRRNGGETTIVDRSARTGVMVAGRRPAMVRYAAAGGRTSRTRPLQAGEPGAGRGLAVSWCCCAHLRLHLRIGRDQVAMNGDCGQEALAAFVVQRGGILLQQVVALL